MLLINKVLPLKLVFFSVVVSVLLTACSVETGEHTEANSARNKEATVVAESKNLEKNSSDEILLTTAPIKKWCLQLKLPDGNWRLKINNIYRNTAQIIVHVSVFRQSGNALQMITQAASCAPINLDNEQPEIYVIGKSWQWNNAEKVSWVTNWPELPKDSQLIYHFKKEDRAIKPAPGGILDR